MASAARRDAKNGGSAWRSTEGPTIRGPQNSYSLYIGMGLAASERSIGRPTVRPTNSHLTCAAEIINSGSADEVWLVPCGPRDDKPYLKTSPLDRYCMCRSSAMGLKLL